MNVLPENTEFTNILAGYLGLHREEASVNSAFFAEFWNNDSQLELPLVFPQRIPRRDFFEEVLAGQPTPVQELWGNRLRALIERRNLLAQNTKWDPASECRLLNMERALLRLGALEALLVAPTVSGLSADGAAELALVRATAELSEELSQAKIPSLRRLKACIDQLSEKTGHEVQVAVGTLGVASAFRYFREGDWLELARGWTTALLKRMESTEPGDSFRRLILHSMAYRAAAMDSSRGKEFQQEALERALSLAEQAALVGGPQSRATLLAARDNLFTLCQTLSKWYGKNNPTTALQYYNRMVELDPFDSVAYSERGLFEFNLGNLYLASRDFKRASELGPPGLGMNLYFLGKTYKQMGNLPLAMETFQESQRIDPLAVSPCLELFEIHQQLKQLDEASQVAHRILNDPDLSDQLSEEERQSLRLAVIS